MSVWFQKLGVLLTKPGSRQAKSNRWEGIMLCTKLSAGTSLAGHYIWGGDLSLLILVAIFS